MFLGFFFFAVRGPLTVVASPVAEHRLRTRRLGGHGSRTQPLYAMWDLPGPGHEPVPPESAGGLSTTVRTVPGCSWQIVGAEQSFRAGLCCCCGTRASHCCGLSRCGAQAPDAQARWPWLTGPAAPRHVGSSRTKHEPTSPASAGGLSTTAPPGKPYVLHS